MSTNFQRTPYNNKRHHRVIAETEIGKNRDILLELKQTREGDVISVVQRVRIDTDISMMPQYRELMVLSAAGLLNLIDLLSGDDVYNKITALSNGQPVQAVSEYEN